MPSANIRVVARYLGGGLGCEGQLWWPGMLWAMLASRKTDRPVRLELSRAQMFTLVGRRQETVQDLALGFIDGRLTAIEHDVVAQTSTHAEFSDSTAVYTRILYACPNVTTRHRLVRTNEPHPIPMRAPGTAPGTFALESAMDEAAELVGIDPLELRLDHFADRDQESGRPGAATTFANAIASARSASAGPSAARDRQPGTAAGRSASAWPPCSIRPSARPAACAWRCAPTATKIAPRRRFHGGKDARGDLRAA